MRDVRGVAQAAPLDGRRIGRSRALSASEASGDRCRTGVTLREVERILSGARVVAARALLQWAGSPQRMRERLSGVPEPLADLDHVQATAQTVLARVRHPHERYQLDAAAAPPLGDHDATSLAFEVLGARAGELRAVDVDQRQLAFLAGVDTWFADLRVGLPAPLRGRFHLVLTDPPYSPAGVGLFAARALEAMKR